jgi:hypothetical protein
MDRGMPPIKRGYFPFVFLKTLLPNNFYVHKIRILLDRIKPGIRNFGSYPGNNSIKLRA